MTNTIYCVIIKVKFVFVSIKRMDSAFWFRFVPEENNQESEDSCLLWETQARGI